MNDPGGIREMLGTDFPNLVPVLDQYIQRRDLKGKDAEDVYFDAWSRFGAGTNPMDLIKRYRF